MTTEPQTLAVREEFALPAQASVEAQLAEIEVFQRLVKNRLIDGHDFGIIPGTQKPTMLLPGAQKITKLAKCRPHYIVLREVEDWDREPQALFAYTIQCQLIYLPTGEIVDEGIGECNSMESKYRWRQRERECPQCGEAAIIKGKAEYGGGWLCFRKKGGCGAKFNDNDPAILDQPTGRVLNPDIADQNNTILKMAKKRALVDAALSLGSLADLFTQDLDDMSDPGPPADVRSSPAEPTSEGEGTEQQARAAGERGGKTAASHEAMTGESLMDDEPESDGEPALFDKPLATFNNANTLKKALVKEFGLDTQEKVEEVLATLGLPVWAQVNLNEAYAAIAHHFAEQGGSDA